MSDIFGEELTVQEMQYWMVFNILSSAKMYSIETKNLSLNQIMLRITAEKQKREAKRSHGKSKGSAK